MSQRKCWHVGSPVGQASQAQWTPVYREVLGDDQEDAYTEGKEKGPHERAYGPAGAAE